MPRVTTLTVAEAARVAEVSPRTVRVHLASGRLKGVKVGRDWTIADRDLRAWLQGYTPYDTLRRPVANPTQKSLGRVADKAAGRLGYRWVGFCRHCGQLITSQDAQIWRHRRSGDRRCPDQGVTP